MLQRAIGQLSVSVVGIGCNNFGRRLDRAATAAVVDAAIDAEVNFFDTADLYGGTDSEVFLGAALGRRRDQVVIATKFGMPLDDERYGAAPDYVVRALEDSLTRLGTDHVDLYQLHAPDPTVPVGETLAALQAQVAAGKVRELGCSNFSPAQLAEAAAAAGDVPGFVSVQNQYSLLWREPEQGTLEACDALGMAFLPYYPLANGLLTGKYRAGEPLPEGSRLALMANGDPARAGHWLSEEVLAKTERVLELAASSGVAVLDLAFTWLLSHHQVASVIAGASRPEQVRANVAAAQATVSPELLAELDALTA